MISRRGKGYRQIDWENVMDIRYGLISADSHVVTDKNAFVERMAKSKWGERIPQIVQVDHKGQTVDRWAVYGKPLRGLTAVSVGAVVAAPEKYAAKAVRVEGKNEGAAGKPALRVTWSISPRMP